MSKPYWVQKSLDVTGFTLFACLLISAIFGIAYGLNIMDNKDVANRKVEFKHRCDLLNSHAYMPESSRWSCYRDGQETYSE